MKALRPAVLSACLVCFVAFLGISAGKAESDPPVVISPLATAPDPIVTEALAAVAGPEAVAAPRADAAGSANPPGDASAAWKMISAGGMHSCGISADDTLACWGDNSFGQAGPPEGRFAMVSAGLVQSCAIDLKGRLNCWGASSAIPAKPRSKYKDVSAGDGHTCAIRRTGAIDCWGDNTWQQTQAPKWDRFESLSAGGRHTCAIRIDGHLACWGEPSFMAHPLPQGRFKDVTTGEEHACALRDDDSVVCWGNDAYAETQVPGGSFKSIASGNFDTCGLRYDGTVECWGRDDFGETDAPAGEIFKALSAGGAHVCGIRLDDTLGCWGSNRNEMVGVDLFAGVGPQGFPFSFLMQVSGFLGTGLVNYGKGIDQKWDKQESKNIRIQLALLGASLVMSAVQGFMPQPPDPVAESLKRIEADIAELKAAVARIESALKQIQGKLDTLACNVSLQPLVNAGVKIKTAQQVYAQRMDQAQIVLKAYAAKAKDPKTEVPDVSQDLQKFVNDYEGQLREALNAIHEALVPAISSKTGPLEECMFKSFEQWKSAAKTPFDDRTYYEPVYEILGYALAYQNMALTLLQDIDLWHAQQQLKAGKVDYSPGEMVGYCAIVREKAKTGDAKAAYWQQAQASCDDATALTQRTYNNMVAQIERAGAPYTGEDTVLSLGSKVIGKGSEWAQSWLWVRDVDAYGDTQGNFNAELPAPTNTDRTREFLYYNWKGDGQAWRVVEDVLYHMMSGNEQKDLPTVMRDQAGFKNITERVFWMAGETFNVKWREFIKPYDNPDGFSFSPSPSTENMKCFVASGIHHPWDKDRHVNGVVCSEWQMGQFTWRTTWEDGKCLWGDCFYDVGSRSSDDNGYAKYVPVLGNFWGRWYTYALTAKSPEWQGIKESALFFPGRDGPLRHWPVIDVAELKCAASMVDNKTERKKVNSIGAPTRCGNDLDRVINAIVPRPDSVQARIALSDEVRKVPMSYSSQERVLICHVAENNNNEWARVSGYSWEIQDSALERTAVINENDQAGYARYRFWTELAGKVGHPKVFLVRCTSTVAHAPTETRYRVASSWYQFNTETKEFKEYK